MIMPEDLDAQDYPGPGGFVVRTTQDGYRA